MLNKIINIVTRSAYVDPSVIHPGTSLAMDLDMDRVDRMALPIQLEDGLHISIDTDKMCGFETIQDIEDYAVARKRIRQVI